MVQWQSRENRAAVDEAGRAAWAWAYERGQELATTATHLYIPFICEVVRGRGGDYPGARDGAVLTGIHDVGLIHGRGIVCR